MILFDNYNVNTNYDRISNEMDSNFEIKNFPNIFIQIFEKNYQQIQKIKKRFQKQIKLIV